MATVKNEYINRTYQTLLTRQSNIRAQANRFNNLNYGVNTPVDSKALDDVPSGKVILTQEVFEQLQKINDNSERAGAEFAYILTGITEGQTVRFDNIVWCKNQGNRTEADFSPLLPHLNSYVQTVQSLGEDHAIVCNGHTHPKQLSRWADDFSLADMAGFMQMKEENRVFKDGTIDLCGGIMSDMNMNFCFYDDRMQNFYKFNDVVLEMETGEQIPLSCYDRKISREQIADEIMNSGKQNKNLFIDGLRRGAPSLNQQAQMSLQAQRRLSLRRELTSTRNENTNNERID